MAKDQWTPRDLPVLEAIVEIADEGARFVRRHDLVERTGLDDMTVRLALAALAHADPPYFKYVDLTGMESVPNYDAVQKVTSHARRAVGAWPSPQGLADQIIAGLKQAADDTEDEEEAGRLRRTARWFGSAGRDVLVGVAASVLAGQAGS